MEGSAPSTTAPAPAQSSNPSSPGKPKPSNPQPQGGNPFTQAASEAQGAYDQATLGDAIKGAGEGGDPGLPEDHEGKEAEDTDVDDGEALPDMNDKQVAKLLAKMPPAKLAAALEGAKLQFKVSGKTVQGTFGELQKLAGQGARMFQAMEESAAYRKDSERYGTIMERCSKDPDTWLELGRQLGHDVDEIVQRRSYDILKKQLMSPEERQAYDKDQELERYRNRDKEEAEKGEKAKAEQQLTQARENLQSEVLTFFRDRNERPDRETLARTLEVMQRSLSRGQRLPVAQAFKIAEDDINALVSRKLETLSPDKLPPSVREKVRQQELARFRAPGSSSTSQVERQPKQPSRPSQPKQPLTLDQWFDSIDQRLSSKKS